MKYCLVRGRKVTFALFFLLNIFYQSSGQNWEIGFGSGSSNYLGEIGGDLNDGQSLTSGMESYMTRLAGGIYLRHYVSKISALRLNMIYGQIAGDDRYSNSYSRKLRNLHFKSHIFEVSGQFEIAIFQKDREGSRYFIKGLRGWNRKDFRSYAFAGIGMFHFDPKAQYESYWHALQPLGTEGQGTIEGKEAYSLIQTSIPIGLGLSMQLGQKFRLGIETGWRKTFTDYLDDVSTNYTDNDMLTASKGETASSLANRTAEVTEDANDLANFTTGSKRGNPKNKDSYLFTMITFGWMIDKPKQSKW